MDNYNRFIIFDYRRRTYLFFLQLILFFPLAFYCFVFVHLLFNKYVGDITILIFSSIIVLVLYNVIIWIFSKMIYIDKGHLVISVNNVQILLANAQNIIKFEDINTIYIHYSGDKYWFANNRYYHLFKVYVRFNNLGWLLNPDEQLDYVEINNVRYYIKITNRAEKQLMLDLKSVVND